MAGLSMSPAATAALKTSLPATALKTTSMTPAAAAKARATAQDFEAVFLNSMFNQMFGASTEGPFSGGHAASTGARCSPTNTPRLLPRTAASASPIRSMAN